MSHAELSALLDFGNPEDYDTLDLPLPRREGRMLAVDAEALGELCRHAFSKIAYLYPLGHLEKLADILLDPGATDNEKFVARTLLENAAVAAEGILPMCQDTGTALAYGWKGEGIAGAHDLGRILDEGIAGAYAQRRLRASQLGPLTVLEEKNTRDNLPSHIDIRSCPGDAFRFLFAAKGGGSTSRTSLSLESPAILNEDALSRVLAGRVGALGASGCPPYTISVALGGSTPSQALYVMELAAFGLFDRLPGESDGSGKALRSREWEERLAKMAMAAGPGAQWGGRHLALETRFIRLPRHAATLPLAMGVSCSAHRKARAYVDETGWYMEKLEDNPRRFLNSPLELSSGTVEIDLSQSKESWLAALRALPSGTRVSLSGKVCLARDAAHARLAAMLSQGKELPSYVKDHPIFYAGPTDPPPGYASGSFGPTTSSRMDSFLETFMEQGASLATIGKGGRSAKAKEAIKRHGGVYLAAIGGAAALAGKENVLDSVLVDFPDLGMEALRLTTLDRLPAIVVIDAKGEDFYS